MIESVTREGAVFAELPHKFEAGTVNGGGAWGLKAAIDYLNSIGFEAIEEKENALTALAMEELKKIPHVHVIGSQDPKEHNGILNFTVDGGTSSRHCFHSGRSTCGCACRSSLRTASSGTSWSDGDHKSEHFFLQQ